jgi:hypothetical protein
VRVCFDVTGDLIVDLPNDILTMAQVIGLGEGYVGFDVIYDFDGDGFIGLPNGLLSEPSTYSRTARSSLRGGASESLWVESVGIWLKAI